eukprot:TRINITY_DN3291_c0_g1_i2.p1 TRINITY_DN3291_c0_g1~~TRINITY_DN3291_c0_g1_i2.p1  ORF type:complete len:245 (+),score=58.68 TRINITY_DN3291_c0_g1_i2:123-857(+)
MNDPFDIVRADVEQSLGGITQLHQRWQHLLQEGTINDEFQWTERELKSALKSIIWDVQDLEDTIRVVEKDLARFHISESDLHQRKDFIRDARNQVEQVQAELSSPATKNKVAAAQRKSLISKPTSKGRYDKLDEAVHADNQAFIDQQVQMQEHMMEDQLEGVEDLSITIGHIKRVGEDMRDSLHRSDKIMDELEGGIDKTQGRMKKTLKRLDGLIEQADDKCGYYLICILVLALIGVILMVIYL